MILTLTVNVIATDPPPGIRKVSHLGVPVGGVGSFTTVRTAFPDNVTEPVEAYVKLIGSTSDIATPDAPPAPAALLTVIV